MESEIEDWKKPLVIRCNLGQESEFPGLVHARDGVALDSVTRSYYWTKAGKGSNDSAQSFLGEYPPIHDTWSVLRYFAEGTESFRQLLARFPKGTTFAFPTGMLGDGATEERVFDEFAHFLAAHDSKLVRTARPQK